VADFNERALRVREVLEAQGWTDMVEDHRPTEKEIVQEFYMNLYQRRGESFRSWIRGKAIEVTYILISTIIRGTSCV
jgi:hypothetical protein